MLNQLSIKEFIKVTAANEPIPGGGSVSALNGALAAALGQMVAALTIGKKKYVDCQAEMEELITLLSPVKDDLIADIDKDSDAYNEVFNAFKMPKETEEEKALRSEAIQTATRHAAEIPFGVAEKTLKIMPLLEIVAEKGNHNAVTDACVAAMCARTAVLGALLNVEINLGSLKDTDYVDLMRVKCEKIRQEAIANEQAILDKAKQFLC